MKKEEQFIVYTDGGSRGNPGPAALGVVISDSKGNTLKAYGEYIGKTTNNDAEYQAVIYALKKIKALIGKKNTKTAKVNVYSDSQLLVNQLNGTYKIKEEHIAKLFIEVWNLKVDFGEVTFSHVPREKNKEADAMVNKALDSEGSTLF